MDSIKKFLGSKTFSGTVIVTIGLFVGSVFSYLLQMILGRLLSVSDYGAFNALLSLSVILTVLSTALSTSLIKLISKLKAGNKFDTLTHIFRNLTFYLLIVGSIIFFVIYLLRGFLSEFFHILDFHVLVSFGVLLGISFLAILPLSYLQGLLRFKAFAFWSGLRGFFRFLLPTLFVIGGFGLIGTFTGMSLAVLCSFGISLLLLKKNFRTFDSEDLKDYYKQVLLFTGPVLFVQISMNLLNNIDVILVKHFFDEVSAGLYSGVVTVGKILLFGAGTVGVVMFPLISEAFAKKEDYVSKFKPFLFLQLLVVILGVLGFSLLPKVIVGVMFGEKFMVAASYVALFSIFIGLYVLVNFFVLFFLAIEKTQIVFFQIPAVIGQWALIYLFHSSINQVIYINIFVTLLLFICIMLYYLYNVGFRNSSSL